MNQELAMTFLRGTFNAFQSCTQKLGQEAKFLDGKDGTTPDSGIISSIHISGYGIQEMYTLCRVDFNTEAHVHGATASCEPRSWTADGNTTAYARGPVKGA